MFGKPKNLGVGKPKTEKERKEVNKRLKDKYGYEEAFGKPKRKETKRTSDVSRGLKAAGLSDEEINRMKGKK